MSIRFTRQENGTYLRSGDAPTTKTVMLHVEGGKPFVSDVYNTLPLALAFLEESAAKFQLKKEWYAILENTAPELTDADKERLKNLAAQNKQKRAEEKAKLAAEEAKAAAALSGSPAPKSATADIPKSKRTLTPKADKPKPPKRVAKVLDPNDPSLTPVQKWRLNNKAAIKAAAAAGITLGEWRKLHPENK